MSHSTLTKALLIDFNRSNPSFDGGMSSAESAMTTLKYEGAAMTVKLIIPDIKLFILFEI